MWSRSVPNRSRQPWASLSVPGPLAGSWGTITTCILYYCGKEFLGLPLSNSESSTSPRPQGHYSEIYHSCIVLAPLTV